MKVLMATVALTISVACAHAAQPQALTPLTEARAGYSWKLDPPADSFSALSAHGGWRFARWSGQADDERWDGGRDWGRFGDDDDRGDHGDSGSDGWHDDDHGGVSAVPEAANWMLMACGAGFLGLLLSRKNFRS